LELKNTFFQENFNTIQDLNQQYSNYQKKLNGEISGLSSDLQEEVGTHGDKINMWIWTKSTLVLSFNFAEGEISIDTILNPKGWSSVLFPRKPENKPLCDELSDFLDCEKVSSSGQVWTLFDEDICIGRGKVHNALTDLISKVIAFMDSRS